MLKWVVLKIGDPENIRKPTGFTTDSDDLGVTPFSKKLPYPHVCSSNTPL
jgi:hypothetical protein